MARHGHLSRPESGTLAIVSSLQIDSTNATKRMFLKVELDIGAVLLDDSKDLFR